MGRLAERGALLTEILGLPAVTARQHARRSRGFLATNLPGELARRLQEACAGRGLGVHVVPHSDVIPTIKPLRIHQVWIAEDALWVRATDLDAKTPLAWDTLRLIAVTRTTKKETFRHWKTTGGTGRTGPNLKVTAYTEEYAEYLADLFTIVPPGQVHGVRLVSRELNYAEALGDMTPDAVVDANARTDGFRLLLSSIAARASKAHIPPESRALLAKPARGSALMPPAAPLDDFDAYNCWLLQRLRLQEQEPQGGVGPQ